ncbi:MAG TPA: hypothetical protein DDY18_06205 [Flavobacterium sp.]|jgi:oligoribonuclease (3'-5' exoribonuclease)|nr:hypothetical protein [Flavobacterium sp.]
MHYLWFDTETGGTNPKIHSLLTAYFALCDKDLNVFDELYLQLKPSDITKINVVQEAMDVNKINLEEHLKDPATITYEEGKLKLQAFLSRNKIKGKRRSFMPAGHNVAFDKEMLWNQMISQEEFEKDVHYRTIDTSSITTFLKDVGILPEDLGNLSSLVEHYGVPKREAHTAKDDVRMNIDVYRAMRKQIQAKKQDMIGGTTNSLLAIVEG